MTTRSIVPLLIAAGWAGGCSGDGAPATADKPVDSGSAAVAPAGSPAPSPSLSPSLSLSGSAAATPTASPPTAPPAIADTPGTHLDDDALPHAAPHAPAQPHPAAHPIDITLRTTPGGARATVDGQPIGNTPTFWSGDANGKEHEFTFVYDGRAPNGQRFAVARYRFVPVTSGIIHVKLEPLIGEEQQAGSAAQPPPHT